MSILLSLETGEEEEEEEIVATSFPVSSLQYALFLIPDDLEMNDDLILFRFITWHRLQMQQKSVARPQNPRKERLPATKPLIRSESKMSDDDDVVVVIVCGLHGHDDDDDDDNSS